VHAIRRKAVPIHRTNGYTILLLSLAGTANALITTRHAFGGGLETDCFVDVKSNMHGEGVPNVRLALIVTFGAALWLCLFIYTFYFEFHVTLLDLPSIMISPTDTTQVYSTPAES
jgi:hypothetical protein